jgi:3D-(3,5/4)-trihydroxycyclohexane-1,2-dione acylhydrolase (decyclizing)
VNGTSARMTMAAALVRFLKQQYVERDGVEHRLICGVAGIFGHGNVAGFGQALEELGGDDLPFFQPKNEQGMVHMASAFAKSRRRLGTLACTTSVGPGATNMVTGAATATINRLPVLLLPGDIFANRWPAPVLQQLENPHSMDISVNDCFKPVSRYWDRINRPEQILQSLPEAMRVLASPAETGAVTICLPEDVQAEAYDYPQNFFQKKVYRVARPLCDSTSLVAAVEGIRSSRRPLIVAGGGVHYSDAAAVLRELVTQTGLPVGLTQAGKGALPDSHARCLGAIGATGTFAANRMAHDADFVLLIGTRLSDFTTASKTLFQNPEVRFASIQINSFDAHKHGAIALVGDARTILLELQAALEGFHIEPGYDSGLSHVRMEWTREHYKITHPPAVASRPLHQSEVIRIVNENTDENSTVVHAAGGLPGDLHKLWLSRHGEDYHSEYGYSCMGYEIAGALGVKLAHPKREVYALLGDGSYLMLHTELLTSVQEDLKMTVVLVDNGGYQCIHGLQRACGGRSFGNEFRRRNGSRRLEGDVLPIDFVQNARSLGLAAYRADTEAKLVAALKSARAEPRSTLIHVRVEPASVPGFAWWDVPMAEVSELESVRKERARYDEAMEKRNFYY